MFQAPFGGVWGHAASENFENVGSQIAGNCTSGFTSNLNILSLVRPF